MKSTCEHCKHWDDQALREDFIRQGQRIPKDMGAGYCTRFPPTLIAAPQGPLTAWPVTGKVAHCGEWAGRVEIR